MSDREGEGGRVCKETPVGGGVGGGFVNDQVCVHRDGVCGRGVDLEGGQHSGKPVLPTSTVDQEPSSLSVPSTGEYRGWN